MKYSIIPEIINLQKIQLLDENDVIVPICKDTKIKYLPPFKEPFFIIDTFAKKTTSPKEIKNLDLNELRTIGFILTSTRAGRNRWFAGQRIIYRIEETSNMSPGAKKIKFIPEGHQVQKDVINKSIRLIGPNAGYPRKGDGGPWIEIKN